MKNIENLQRNKIGSAQRRKNKIYARKQHISLITPSAAKENHREQIDLKSLCNNRKGEIEKYKTRLVAKRFSQRNGKDYDETLAVLLRPTLPTGRSCRCDNQNYTSLILTVILTAFLYEDLKDVYMSQPDAFGEEGKVCRLNKTIYDLK